MHDDRGHRALLLRTYLNDDPANLALAMDWIDALLEAQDVEGAARALGEVLTAHPDAPALRFRMALVDQAQERHDGALQRLAELTHQGWTAPAVQVALARSLLALRREDEALCALDTLASEDIEAGLAAQAVHLRVRALHCQGRLTEAIRVAEFALANVAGSSSRLESAVASLYLDANRLGDARRMVDRAAQQGDLDAEILTVDGFLALHRGQGEEALRRFTLSVEHAPLEGRTHLGLGLSLAAQGQLADAEIALQRCTELMPSHLGGWHALAWTRLCQDQVASARTTFEAALSLDRTFADSHGGLAIVAWLEGDGEAARQWIRSGSKLDPASATVMVAQALVDHGAADLRDPRFVQSALSRLPQRHALSVFMPAPSPASDR